nr:MAG TPA: hypothetical protein [Bacteriophage sp.]
MIGKSVHSASIAERTLARLLFFHRITLAFCGDSKSTTSPDVEKSRHLTKRKAPATKPGLSQSAATKPLITRDTRQG